MNYNNFAQRTNFIAGSNQFDNVPFFLTNLNIPGIVLSHPEAGGRSSTRMNLSSDTVFFNSLTFDMLIDEDFLIYQELMGIIRKNIDINNGTFKDFCFDFFIELNNNKGNKVLKLYFTNCRIASIGDVQLSTQDDGTEYSLSMEMVYDYYEIDQIRRFDIIGVNPPTLMNPPDVPYPQKVLSESFVDISDDWQLWGFPSPILINDSEATNGTGFDSNGTGSYESGAVLNGVPIDVLKPFNFTFRVKQPLGADSNDAYYIEFGVTEGIGIQSTSNGRTGSTIMSAIVDGGNANSGTSIKALTYNFKNRLPDVKPDYSNDGQFHEYRFTYTINGANAEYQIYKDNIIQSSFTTSISDHDYLYLFIQGRSDGGPQIVDTISGNYGEDS